jgi:hypothetical protein
VGCSELSEGTGGEDARSPASATPYYAEPRRCYRANAVGRVALDKSEGAVKDKNVLSVF